jgi:Fe-S-cluster containining protein
MREYETLSKISAEWDLEFARNKAIYKERIHCRKGCNECCSQLFQITELEAAYISKAVKRMPPDQQVRLKQRALQYLRDREDLLARHDIPDAWGSLPKPGLRLPCPALEQGACSIYTHRPLICHKYGIPLYNPRKPDQIFACELNFKPGESIDVTELVQIQTGIWERWTGEQASYTARAGRRDEKPVTVARAILEDFETCVSSCRSDPHPKSGVHDRSSV